MLEREWLEGGSEAEWLEGGSEADWLAEPDEPPTACPYGQDGEAVCCGNPEACGGPRRGRVWLDDGEAV